MLNTCIQIAKEAGALIFELSKKPRQIEKKAAFDLVTDADKAANDLIVKRLFEEFPEHQVLAEEAPSLYPLPQAGEGILWIVDPIDGTTNYARGIPQAAVSIGAYHTQTHELLVGCVFNPFNQECFWAEKNKGAFLNGQRIHASQVSKLTDAIATTGYYNHENLCYETSNLPETYAFLKKCLGLRRYGAASLDLCWVAMGRFDIYWEKGLKAWDMAAGVLILQEAGGLATDYRGEKLDLFHGPLLATNGHLHLASIQTLDL